MRFASIDIGSNSLRLLVAERTGGSWRTVHSQTRVSRLSGGFDPKTRLLHPASIDRTVGILAEYGKTIRELGARATSAASTGITRKAVTRRNFSRG